MSTADRVELAAAVKRVELALDRLVQLGSVEAIRDHLIAEGITGTPGHCDTCPVAGYLTRAAGTPIAVGPLDWGIGPDWQNPRYLPPKVRRFIGTFDRVSGSLDPALDPAWRKLRDS